MNNRSKDTGQPVVGYVVKRFPRLSETFIINELLILKEMGCQLVVYSLTDPEPEQQEHLLALLDVPVVYLSIVKGWLSTEVRTINYAYSSDRDSTIKKQISNASEGVGCIPGKSATQRAVLELQASLLAILARKDCVTHLHAHFASDATTVAMLASRSTDIPYSLTAHAKDIFHTYSNPIADRAFLKKKLEQASFTITVSNYNKDYLKRLAPDADVVRLYNGIDLQKLKFQDHQRHPNSIVAVGRLVEKKGFIDLIKACAELKNRGVLWDLRIIGDGPLKEPLRDLVVEFGLADKISFLGSMTQNGVIENIKRSSVIALPCVVSETGDRDGLPTVLLEAMAIGTPVISTNVAGIPEMIDHESSGWLVQPGDVMELSRALESALLLSEKERRSMSLNGRSKAEFLFDIRKNVAELYQRFIEKECDQFSSAGGLK